MFCTDTLRHWLQYTCATRQYHAFSLLIRITVNFGRLYTPVHDNSFVCFRIPAVWLHFLFLACHFRLLIPVWPRQFGPAVRLPDLQGRSDRARNFVFPDWDGISSSLHYLVRSYLGVLMLIIGQILRRFCCPLSWDLLMVFGSGILCLTLQMLFVVGHFCRDPACNVTVQL